ncbi:helix-turn-helix transcriptional regulator [Cumulibacter soli]|uniref:helix-turn-helix transcriptional regulator n=1 Tax=Cumulibacter soli TaxID=2546344 RepID=UPI001068CE25|nr:YafY family protein [Cumulibacter soli]
MRADRLLSIVDLLRRHVRLSAADLAARLEVTSRTIQRDIDALSLMGVPVYAERGREGGYALLPGYRPDSADLTVDESKALLIGGAGVADALGLNQAFSRAVRSMASGLPEDHAQQVGRLLDRVIVDPGGWGGTAHNPDALAPVFEAVQRDCRARILYEALSSDNGGRRTVDPWGLVLAGSTWYLVAAHRGKPHTYRISRITDIRLLDEPTRRPERLDVRQVWRGIRAGWNARDSVLIRLRTRRDRVDLALRSLQITLLGEPAVSELDEEWSLIEARVHALRGVVGVLLGFGNWVQALDPPELRAMMADTAAEALAQYRESGWPASS